MLSKPSSSERRSKENKLEAPHKVRASWRNVNILCASFCSLGNEVVLLTNGSQTGLVNCSGFQNISLTNPEIFYDKKVVAFLENDLLLTTSDCI